MSPTAGFDFFICFSVRPDIQEKQEKRLKKITSTFKSKVQVEACRSTIRTMLAVRFRLLQDTDYRAIENRLLDQVRDTRSLKLTHLCSVAGPVGSLLIPEHIETLIQGATA